MVDTCFHTIFFQLLADKSYGFREEGLTLLTPRFDLLLGLGVANGIDILECEVF